MGKRQSGVVSIVLIVIEVVIEVVSKEIGFKHCGFVDFLFEFHFLLVLLYPVFRVVLVIENIQKLNYSLVLLLLRHQLGDFVIGEQ